MVYLVVGVALMGVAALIQFAQFSVQGALFLVGAIAALAGLFFAAPQLPRR